MNILGTAVAALLNSLWQSAGVALLVWAAFRFLPRLNVQINLKINAATRCAVWWAVLAAVVLLPMAPQQTNVPRKAVEAPLPSSESAAIPGTIAPVPVASLPVSPRPVETASPSSHANGPLEITAGAGLLAIFAIWSALSLFRIAQIIRSYRYLRGIKQRSRAVSPERMVNFNYWLLACGVDRTARLLVSREIVSPMAVGFRRPAVVVPETLLNEFTPEELDHVLLHELAHLARYDDWTNLFARLIGALLPIHPVAVWLVKQIEQDREAACDDWVVAMTGEARPYAASLTRLFELCSARRRQLLATGMADRASHLGERIEALLRSGRDFAPRVSLVRVALGAAILLGLVLASAQAPHWVAFAQEPAVPQLPDVPQVPAVVPVPPVAQVPPVPPVPPVPVVAPQAPQSPIAAQDLFLRDIEDRQAEAQRMVEDTARVLQELAEKGRTYTPDHPEMRKLAAELRAMEQQLRAEKAQMQARKAQIGLADGARVVDELRARQAEMQAYEQRLLAMQATQRPQNEQRAQRNPNGSFLAALVAAGYGDLSVDEIIQLRSNGVSSDFLRGLSQTGWGKLPPRDLINLARNGVSPDYLAGMKTAGFKNLTPEGVIEMAQHGVRPQAYQEIHALGFGPYSPKEASDFASHGVGPELFRALKDTGFTKVEPAEIIEAANNGIRADNLRAAREFGPSKW